MLLQMLTQGLHAVALSGMMARCDKMNTLFSRDMHSGLGHLTGYEQVCSRRYRGLKVTLGSSRAPRDAPDRCRSVANMQRLTACKTLYA